MLIEPNLLDTAHGFAARPDLELPEVKTAFAGALVQTVDWFKKTLWFYDYLSVAELMDERILLHIVLGLCP